MLKLLSGCAVLAILVSVNPVMAEDAKVEPIPAEHAEMYHKMMDKVEHVKGLYDVVMEKMHKSIMETKQTGDADVDFVTGMIPHHQGAIDMAKIVLEKGRSPEIKKLAQGIIITQEAEIKVMNDWLAANKK
jgi:uncharacterized protein (DUF305 family)